MARERTFIDWKRVDSEKLKEVLAAKEQQVRALIQNAASTPNREIDDQKTQYELLIKIMDPTEQNSEAETPQVGGYELTTRTTSDTGIIIIGSRTPWARKPNLHLVENLVLTAARETGLNIDMPYYNPDEAIEIVYELRTPSIEIVKFYKNSK